MRKKKYENFIAKLMMTKDIIDAAELEKHIRNVVGYDKSSLEKEYFRINELIENQYEKYGIINEGDNIDRKSTRLNSSHRHTSRMPSSA